MRKLILQLMTTLNGRVDDPDAWVHDVPEDLYAEIDRVYDTFDTILVGQTTYEEMAAYWPSAGIGEGASETHQSMARKMNLYKKYVFSSDNEKKELKWNNAEQVLAHSDEDIRKFVTGLKEQSGKDIHLAGGASLTQTFVRLGLVDEYHFFVYPVVSQGKAWYEKVKDKREMKLLSITPFTSGIIGLYFQPK